jgi:hypothetical protein
MKQGAQINLPSFYYPIMKFVVPIMISVILVKGIIDSLLPRLLAKQWVDLPGFTKKTASFGERIAYEFGFYGRELVENPTIAAEAVYRWGARLEMLILCIIVMALTGYAWNKYRKSKRGGEHEI